MAKTKQDYFNAGVEYAKANAKTAHSYAQTTAKGWQAKAFQEGYKSVSNGDVPRGTKEIVLKRRPNSETGGVWWSGFDVISGKLIFNHVKRKTHARNVVLRAGYKIIN